MIDKLDKKPIPEDGEVHLFDYLIVLAKHSRMIIFSSAAVTSLTFLILFLLVPNKYTATSRILPPQQNMTLSAQLLETLGGSTLPSAASGSGFSGMAANLLGLKSPGELYVGILNGNAIFDRIIDRFNLKEHYKSWIAFKEPYIEDIRKDLSKRTEITCGKDGLITIEATDEDPKQAAAMANAFVEEMDKSLQRIAVNEAKERLAFLEKEWSQASFKLGKAEEAVRNFSERSSVVQIDAQTKSILEYVANLRATIDAKEVQIKVMRQQATSHNYDVIRLETELIGLQEKLRAAETQESKNLCVDNAMIATSKVPALGLEYIRLYREAKFQEALYQLYCKLVELARLDVVRDASVVQVIDPAIPPEQKSKPKRILTSLMAGAGVFFLMGFIAFVKEYWQIARQQEGTSQRLDKLSFYMQPWRNLHRHLFFWKKKS